MKIVFFGDSIIEGSYGVSFLDLVKQELNKYPIEFLNKGEMGDTSYNLLKRVERDVLSVNPQYVFIHTGINDVMSFISHKPFERMDKWVKAVSPDLFYVYITEIVNTLLENKIKVVLLLPGSLEGSNNQWKNKVLEEYKDKIQRIAKEYHLPTIDSRDSYINKDIQNMSHNVYDFILPNVIEDMKNVFSNFPPYKVRDNKELKQQYYKYLDQLSKERGLYLTFDGIHYTYQGAEIMSQKIIGYIKKEILMDNKTV